MSSTDRVISVLLLIGAVLGTCSLVASGLDALTHVLTRPVAAADR